MRPRCDLAGGGIHRAQTADQRKRREAWLEALLSQIPVIPFDLLTARIHARIWADLLSRGVVVGAHDLMIAATALANGCQVATRDERSFPRVPDLGVVRW